GPMSSFEAEIGLLSLQRWPERCALRSEIARFYRESLSELAASSIQIPSFLAGYTWSHFPVVVSPERRNLILRKLERETGLEIGVIVDYSVADLPYYQKTLATRSCPIALRQAQGMLNLPLTLAEGFCHREWRAPAEKVVRVLRDELSMTQSS